MTLFWILVAALLLCSILFIWWPSLRGSQSDNRIDRNAQNIAIFRERVAELENEREAGTLDDQGFADLKRELELNLLQEVPDDLQQKASSHKVGLWLPIGLSLLVPALSLTLYLQYGASDLLGQPKRQQTAETQAAPHSMNQMDAQIAALKARLEQEPDNRQGWFMLGRTYMTLERYEDAFNAFGRLGQLTGENAEILGLQAQAIYFGMGHQLVAEAASLVDRALELDPGDPGTIGLLGISAYESGQYEEAIQHWQGLLNSNRPNVNRDGLQSAIAQAVEQLRQQGVDYQPSASASPQPSGQDAGPQLRVAVSLAPALAGRLPAETTLFIYAQAVDGPRMPLAVARMQLKDLPVEVTLNDSMAMAPMAKLSGFEQVQIKATATRSGTPGAKPGDLLGMVSPVAVQNNDNLIQVVIDQQVQ